MYSNDVINVFKWRYIVIKRRHSVFKWRHSVFKRRQNVFKWSHNVIKINDVTMYSNDIKMYSKLMMSQCIHMTSQCIQTTSQSIQICPIAFSCTHSPRAQRGELRIPLVVVRYDVCGRRQRCRSADIAAFVGGATNYILPPGGPHCLTGSALLHQGPTDRCRLTNQRISYNFSYCL